MHGHHLLPTPAPTSPPGPESDPTPAFDPHHTDIARLEARSEGRREVIEPGKGIAKPLSGEKGRVMAHRTPDDQDMNVAAGIARLEGYLLCQSEIQQAHTAAQAFAQRLPWLTTAQQEEVVRHFAEERLALSRETLRQVAARCAELQGEYTARYRALQQRLLCRCAALLLASAALCATACLVAFTAELR